MTEAQLSTVDGHDPGSALRDHGLDYAWSRPDISAIKAGGYQFVSRYLSWLPNGKVIDASEYRSLRAAGIQVALNWEHTADEALQGAATGTRSATEAVRQARALGYPAGCTIYFSVDFDQTAGQADVCHAYLRAAQSIVHAAGYRIGVYGGIHAVRRALDARVVDDAWQTFAWSAGQWEPRATLRQIQNGISVDGADCDRDARVGPTHFAGEAGTAPTSTTTELPVEEDNVRIELTKVGEAHVFSNPSRSTGNKTWLLLSSDFGDGVVRVATHGGTSGSGWTVQTFDVKADADLVPAVLLDRSVAKVSVLLQSGTGVFSVDAVGTPVPA
ncbi:MAG: DUF1906 domain-containing protein [Micromonosporaceae bacterium]|nr:DUF1906 domain-containing protein [Micromonosporaceae bacterium]